MKDRRGDRYRINDRWKEENAKLRNFRAKPTKCTAKLKLKFGSQNVSQKFQKFLQNFSLCRSFRRFRPFSQAVLAKIENVAKTQIYHFKPKL